jgi:hypothetical protein
VVNYKKVKVHDELLAGICKGVVNNKNGLGIKFKLKNSRLDHARLGWWSV